MLFERPIAVTIRVVTLEHDLASVLDRKVVVSQGVSVNRTKSSKKERFKCKKAMVYNIVFINFKSFPL